MNRYTWAVLFSIVLIFPPSGALLAEEAFIIIEEGEGTEGEENSRAEEEAPQRITITAKMEAPDPRSLPGQMTIITAEEIAASAPKTVADIIEPVLGVTLSRYGGAGSSSFVSIRGSSAEQVLVLINGKRINSAQGGGVDLSTINPDVIERIEIYRGGDSAVYGENAVGGVINIVTKSTGQEGVKGSVRAGCGSFKTVYGAASLSLAGSEGSRGATITAHGLSSEGNYTFSDDNYGALERENADALQGGAASNAFIRFDSGLKISGNVTLYLDDKGVPGTVEFPSETARMTDERETAGIEAVLASRRGEWVAGGSLIRQVREYQDPDFFSGAVEDRHENTALEGETRYAHTVQGENWAAAWLCGYSYRRDSLDSTALTGSGGTEYGGENILRQRHAGFGRGELRLFPYQESDASRLALFPALRVDTWKIEDYGTADSSEGMRPSWKLGALSALDARERIVLKVSGGTSYRSPSFDDLFWPTTAFAAGNPELEPEEAWFIDGGFILKPIPALQMEGGAFYRRVTNLIQWNPGPNGKWRPINVGRSQFWGLEAELRGLVDLPKIESYLEAGVNGTYLYTEDLTEGSATYGKAIPRKPVWNVNGTASLTHSRGHSLRLELRYIGTRYITAANTKWYDPYLVIDVAATVVLSEGLKFIVSADNLFNVEYVDIREYPVPGIELSAEVRYEF